MTQDLGTIIRYLRWGSIVFFALGALCLILTLILLRKYQVIQEIRYRRTKKRMEAARYRVEKRMREREIAQREEEAKKKRADIEKAVKESRDEATEYLKKSEAPEGSELTAPLAVPVPDADEAQKADKSFDSAPGVIGEGSSDEAAFLEEGMESKDDIPDELDDDFDSMMEGAHFDTEADHPYVGEDVEDPGPVEEEIGHAVVEPLYSDGSYLPDYPIDEAEYDDEETEPLYLEEGAEPTMPLIFVADGEISDDTEDLLDKETAKLENAEEYIRQRHVEFTMMDDDVEIKRN